VWFVATVAGWPIQARFLGLSGISNRPLGLSLSHP
jgi:hypothetical protein